MAANAVVEILDRALRDLAESAAFHEQHIESLKGEIATAEQDLAATKERMKQIAGAIEKHGSHDV